MPNNKPLRKYFTGQLLVASVTAGVTGFWGWILSFILNFAVRYLAREGVRFIDISSTNIRTNMKHDDWVKFNSGSWEKVEQGILTKLEGKNLDNKYIKVFSDFTVFSKVRKR